MPAASQIAYLNDVKIVQYAAGEDKQVPHEMHVFFAGHGIEDYAHRVAQAAADEQGEL